MTEQKKLLPDFKLYAPVDLTKNWFVYWKENGKRQRKYGDINKSQTVKMRTAAAKKLIQELTAKYQSVGPTIKSKLYERVNRKKNIQRKKTIQTYTSKLNMLFEHVGNDNPTVEEVEDFYEYMLLNRHPATYTRYVIDLKSFFREIGLEYYFNNIHTVKYKHSPKRYFQTYQMDRLKTFIPQHSPELWLCVQLLYYCFIRPRESRYLVAGDVLLDEQKILIRGDISKNGKTEYVAIPNQLQKNLEYVRHLAPNTVLFPGNDSIHIGENTMYERHKTVLKKSGFSTKHYSLYSWKHTGVVMAVKAGISVKELQIQLRHHSLDQVDQYLRQLGVQDLGNLRDKFPDI